MRHRRSRRRRRHRWPQRGGVMTEEARDFHASTDQMLEMLEHLREIEQKKQDETLGSERLAALAKEAQQVSRLVFRWSGLQEEAALASVRAVSNGAAPV